MLQEADIINAIGKSFISVDDVVDRVAGVDNQAPPTAQQRLPSVQSAQKAILSAKVQIVINAGIVRGELERDASGKVRKK